MVSVNYSASNASALRSLQATAQAMSETQTRIATGLKINSAKDNAYLWKASEALRSDISSIKAQQDAIKVAQVQADKTGAAVDAIRKVLGQMKGVVEAAGSADTAKKAILQKDMSAYIDQLKSLVASASLDGANLLTGTAPSAVIIGKNTDGAAVTMTLDATDLGLITKDASSVDNGILNGPGLTWDTDTTSALTKSALFTFDVSTAGTGNVGTLAAMMTDLNTVITKIDGVSARVAAYSKRLETQADFMTKIADIQEGALSSMVDADLDEESARLSALQVQQQLATTALQIANSARANILRLFQ
ncbi:flagellin [Aureimonas jatrophae]|uniref:Flagellin n=1 Tax=Aureimonas jatrophae TaxID=1166073 RepID=A0A1H0JPZ0_9HYPH|nr:flagellin [Aureimonas jatrophae]MBB3951297.1 flagellin [Aureimonas jatrophae]SDO45788.1 flagellin [Aureimonas jatrophae]